MTGIFRQKNPANNLLLLPYGLVLKFGLFIHPAGAVRDPQDYYMYRWILDFMASMHAVPVVYDILAFLIVYLQALVFNRICSNQKMLPKPNYLPGMAFLLITSLLPEWSRFSSPLLTNCFMIIIFYRMIMLYNINRPVQAIFNIGVLTGIVTLLYQPGIILVFLIIFSLFIMRPFRIQEWLIGLLGVTMPYYLLGIVLFLTNSLHWKGFLPDISFRLPAIPTSIYVTISLALLVLPFIIGGFMVQANLNKMLIQVRKGWSLLLLFLILAMMIILTDAANSYMCWLLCIVPMAAFHGAAYYYPSKKVVPALLHWLSFGYAIYANYFVPGHP